MYIHNVYLILLLYYTDLRKFVPQVQTLSATLKMLFLPQKLAMSLGKYLINNLNDAV